jgi:hypothetical protein
MLTPVDGWTIVHSVVGFFLGRIKFNRLLFYPVPIGWEIYQLYFHYQPQGYYLGYVWLNSLSDILFCSICYEVALRYSFIYDRSPLWLRISRNTKAVTAYVLIACSVTWAFWDDIIRRGLSKQVPSTLVPLMIGAISPAISSFVVSLWIKWEAFSRVRSARTSSKLYYYLFAGFLPSAVIFLVIVWVRGS